MDAMIQRQLTQLFAQQVTLAGATLETDLIATGLLDSLGLVDLLVQLEHEFEIQINLDDLEIDNFRSIGNIAAFIQRQRGETGRLRLVA